MQKNNLVTILVGCVFLACRSSVVSSEAEAKHPSLARRCGEGDQKQCAMLGLARQQDGVLDEARVLYDRACTAGIAYGCYGIGALHEREGRRAEAKQFYEKACSLDPSDGGVEACIVKDRLP